MQRTECGPCCKDWRSSAAHCMVFATQLWCLILACTIHLPPTHTQHPPHTHTLTHTHTHTHTHFHTTMHAHANTHTHHTPNLHVCILTQNSLVIQWLPPLHNGGANITRYHLELSPAPGSSFSPSPTILHLKQVCVSCVCVCVYVCLSCVRACVCACSMFLISFLVSP